MGANFGMATESVMDFINCRPPRDMMKMKRFLAEDLQIATEGFGNGRPVDAALNSKYLSYLIDTLNKKCSKIDFGDIPDSAGNIAKWKPYERISKTMTCVDKIISVEGRTVDYSLMKDLESFLINQRSDFEYGYKTNNALIMMVYQISAMALMDLALVNFVNLANNMSSTKNGIVKPTRNYKILRRSVSDIIQLWKKGDWSKIVKAYRDMRVRPQMSLEAVGTVVSIIGTVALIGVVSVISLIALVSAIRGLISLYFTSLATIDEKARSMEEYLKEITPYETNPEALKKQEKAIVKLSKIAGFIEAKLLKTETAAEAELKKEDSKVTIETLQSYDDGTSSYVSTGTSSNPSGITLF